MGLGPLHPGLEGRGREWREGWGRRVGKRMEGRGGAEGRGNQHTRFKTCGAAHGDVPMMWAVLKSRTGRMRRRSRMW